MTDNPPPEAQELIDNIIDFQKSEQAKYIKCWSAGDRDYAKFSPGEHAAPLFLETAKPHKGATVVDWGCGSGKGSKVLYNAGLDVTAVDFAFNCLDDDVRELTESDERFRFIEHDLSKPIQLPSEYGFCTDVMEHIPEDQVDAVLDSILDNSRHVFFEISTTEDHFGDHPDIQVNGEKEHLHLTVKPYQWWIEKFVSKQVVIHHSNMLDNRVIFYLTGWGSKPLNFDGGVINTDADTIKANMRENAKLGLQAVRPFEAQDAEVMLLAGGPSLNYYTDEIIQQRATGMPLITTNGTYNWAIANGMKPSMQCLIDARKFNERFVTPILGPDENHLVNGKPYQGCQYFISSQCHPDIAKSLPKEQTHMWQVSLDDDLIGEAKELFGKMYEDWFPCPGGSTVTLRTLCLLRMLGYSKIHVYGFDSCVFGKEHHAYEQTENDNRGTMPITVARGTKWEKTFHCEPWMVYQTREFQLMIPRVLKDCQLNIKGDGIIAYMIQSEAEAYEEMQEEVS